jgi:hypothetical protein
MFFPSSIVTIEMFSMFTIVLQIDVFAFVFCHVSLKNVKASFVLLPPPPLVSTDVASCFLASARCHLLRAQLWDIESIDEFDFILARIYRQTQSFDSPRIAVNFTRGQRCKSIEIHRTTNVSNIA